MTDKHHPSINLIYNYLGGGPGKLIKNLTKGLDELKIEHVSNVSDSETHYHGMLQAVDGVHDRKIARALCGPNLFVLPSEWGELCKNYRHYIVPSKWVHNKYRKFSVLDHATIDIWPVGIDTKIWQKTESLVNPNKRALIYFKNRRAQEIVGVANQLNYLKIGYDIIEYGHYTEQQLLETCNRCDFAILLTATESQGIGYMEILSMGLPCYVLDKTVWDLAPQHGLFDATSVPYFDSTCGIVVPDFNLTRLDEFVQLLATYKPREFICNNYTLSKQAQSYYDLLVKYKCT